MCVVYLIEGKAFSLSQAACVSAEARKSLIISAGAVSERSSDDTRAKVYCYFYQEHSELSLQGSASRTYERGVEWANISQSNILEPHSF